jgi:hypothetical protein
VRKFTALLAIAGATLVVALSQTSGAFIDGSHEQPCQENDRRPPAMTLDSPWSDNVRWNGIDGKKSHDGLSNEADQCNGEIDQEATNKPFAWLENENKNKNPQFTLVGSNWSSNDQSNDTWIDQSQYTKAAQANVLWQGIWVAHAPAAWQGGGGPPLSNDADQSNHKIVQDAQNWAFAWVDNKNVNFNPQFTLVGSNNSTNTQSNETSIDQSQNVKAAQVNVAGQAIQVGPPIDPSNDADQSNGKIDQEAWNKPHAFVDNKNVNFNPQFTLVGDNNSSNTQSNNTSIDQSQHVGALQLNVLGQAIGLG